MNQKLLVPDIGDFEKVEVIEILVKEHYVLVEAWGYLCVLKEINIFKCLNFFLIIFFVSKILHLGPVCLYI